MAPNQSYLMAESMEERIAIGIVNILATWSMENGQEFPLPTIEYCQRHIKPYIIKEVLTRVFGELGIKEETIQKRQNDIANAIMVANGQVQKDLRPEYL